MRELGDAGAMLDDQAKLQYRLRLRELAEKLEDLRERGAYERVDEVVSEIDFIQRELARAVGLGGRNRRAGSAAERARLNVTRAIKSAIEKIQEHDLDIGKILGQSIRTGSFCSYVPETPNPANWRFSHLSPRPFGRVGDSCFPQKRVRFRPGLGGPTGLRRQKRKALRWNPFLSKQGLARGM